MPHITPTAEQAAQLAAAAGEESPIVMVNLLRFGDGGAEEYGRYARAVAPLLARVGARVVSSVTCAETVIGPAEERWDLVALVEYPSRRAFLDMIGTPEYLEAHRHREAGVVDSRLIASAPVPSPGQG